MKFKDFTPKGVIPATLLAFNEDFSIDEQATRTHLEFVAKVDGISAITVNVHSSEIHACNIDEQQRILNLSADAIGDRIPLINGVYADGSIEAARIARMAEDNGASSLLVFPPHSIGWGGMQQRPEAALAHFKHIAEASQLPLIVFQYPGEYAYPMDTLLQLVDEIPTIKAIKDWSGPIQHEHHINTLQNLPRAINVLSTNSAWLMASLTMGCNGLLSGAGSVIADLQVALFRAIEHNDLAEARRINKRILPVSRVFYTDPFGDMHNRMKEALVILGRLPRAVVRPPLVKLTDKEVESIGRALKDAGITHDGAMFEQAA
jgi:4-hydroxy-tetrahydrodipicolinate synthase